MTDPQAVLSDLNRVKVLFQHRAICTVLGFPSAAPATFPYPHRTCAEVARDEAALFHDRSNAR